MNIYFDTEELRNILIQVIKNEFKSNMESTLSKLSAGYIEEDLRKTKETVTESLAQLNQLNEKVQQTLETVNAQCSKINAELTGISIEQKNHEEAVGLAEKTTLRQTLEEMHFEIKAVKTEIQDVRAEMTSAAEVKQKAGQSFANTPVVCENDSGAVQEELSAHNPVRGDEKGSPAEKDSEGLGSRNRLLPMGAPGGTQSKTQKLGFRAAMERRSKKALGVRPADTKGLEHPVSSRSSRLEPWGLDKWIRSQTLALEGYPQSFISTMTTKPRISETSETNSATQAFRRFCTALDGSSSSSD